MTLLLLLTLLIVLLYGNECMLKCVLRVRIKIDRYIYIYYMALKMNIKIL